MSQRYSNVTGLPSQANASSCGCANGRENYNGREGYGGRGCAFPQPPPRRCYCQPAQFAQIDGRKFALIGNAYGASSPCRL